ncbi:hypothetical protein B0T16DRAFT_421139 [Cercophora newfieldiana]|uniref:Methyltransferase n=1 Tax=Cercophora newfieldiana TaxID=92897 RepID=A0AA39XZ20_9PEZI|nr:hypothetical protein B0T16DRAFT_421139 [Cercophora newfieldiana]
MKFSIEYILRTRPTRPDAAPELVMLLVHPLVPKHASFQMTVTSNINYTAPLPLYDVEKPYYSNVPAPDGRQSNQVAWTYADIQFHDIRGCLDEFKLDVNGFEVFQFGEEAGDETSKFGTDLQIETDYYPLVERMLKARFGDVRVVIFDHTVRRRRTAEDLQRVGDSIRATRQPSLSAHCDQTILSGENRIKLHMGAAAKDLLGGRCRIVNVWRPLFGPLEDCPLTFCDWRSVDMTRDYKAADLIFPHYIGEQYLVTHHSDHKWHFLSGQQTNEFTLLKCWGNRVDVARCVAHTSFFNPNAPEGSRLRESIELRCMVFGG